MKYSRSGHSNEYSHAGNILWRGKPGPETFHGKGGDDTISGYTGNDKLYGGAGGDGLYGQQDDDKLYGEAGNDKLDGGVGNDTLKGGADTDTFVFSTKYDKDTIVDFHATGFTHDIIDLQLMKSITSFDDLSLDHMKQKGNDVIINGGNGDVLTLKNVDIENLDSSDFQFAF